MGSILNTITAPFGIKLGAGGPYPDAGIGDHAIGALNQAAPYWSGMGDLGSQLAYGGGYPQYGQPQQGSQPQGGGNGGFFSGGGGQQQGQPQGRQPLPPSPATGGYWNALGNLTGAINSGGPQNPYGPAWGAAGGYQNTLQGPMPLRGVAGAIPGAISQYAYSMGAQDPFGGQNAYGGWQAGQQAGGGQARPADYQGIPEQNGGARDINGKPIGGQQQGQPQGQNPYALLPYQQQQLNQQGDVTNTQRQSALSNIKASLAQRGITGGPALDAALQRVNDHFDSQIGQGQAGFYENARQQRAIGQQNIIGQLSGLGNQQQNQWQGQLGGYGQLAGIYGNLGNLGQNAYQQQIGNLGALTGQYGDLLSRIGQMYGGAGGGLTGNANLLGQLGQQKAYDTRQQWGQLQNLVGYGLGQFNWPQVFSGGDSGQRGDFNSPGNQQAASMPKKVRTV